MVGSASKEKMQESLICEHVTFLPAMWFKRQERQAVRLAVRAMEGAGSGAMAGREEGRAEGRKVGGSWS